MKIFYDPIQKTHILTHEIIAGKKQRHHERRSRIDVIVKRLRSTGAYQFVVPEKVPMEAIVAVHDESYIRFLESSQALRKEDIIWPYVFPPDHRVPILEPVTPLTAGAYCFDVGTPIMKDTWSAAIAAASGAYAGAKHLRTTGETSYVLARPPGHHASKDKFGGYCYLNNAAIAANYLSQYGKVLVLDFDFHHGNGTQSIFYDRSDVFYLSLHAHPGSEYPYFTGFETEHGIDDGYGYNLNIPLENRCGKDVYFVELEKALERVFKIMNPEFIVLSAGFDIAENDPLGHFGISVNDFHLYGQKIKALGKKTLIVQEGGYLIEHLGQNVEGFLTAFL